MAKPSITLRNTKGSALTYTELDDNFSNLRDATVSLTADTGGTSVSSDLNGNITLVAGDGISVTGDDTAKTITIENTSLGSNAFATIAVAGQSNVVADSVSDTLTLIAGSGITLTTNATNDSVTITNTGGGGGGLSYVETIEIDADADSTIDTVVFQTIDTSRNFLFRADLGSAAMVSENSDIFLIAELGDIKARSDNLILGVDSSVNDIVITTATDTSLKLSNNFGTSTASIEIQSGAGADVVVVTNGNLDVTGGGIFTGVLDVQGATGNNFSSSITAPKFIGAATQVDVVTYDPLDTANHYLLFAAGVTGDRDVQARSELIYNPNTETIDANITGDCGGNALSATALATARTISASGDITWTSAGFDGSANVSGVATLATVLGTPGSFTMANITVDAKGRITAVSNGGSTISNDTTTNSTRYVLFTDATSGTEDTFNVSNTKLTFNPSTGRFTTTELTSTFVGYKEKVYSLGTTSGTITPDITNGNVQTITLNGNITINSLTSVSAGQSVTLVINTNGTGRTLTSTMKFAGGVNTLSTANTIDVLHIFYDGTNYLASLIKGYI